MTPKPELKKTAAIWAAASAVLLLYVFSATHSPLVTQASFLLKAAAFVVGVAFGTAGGLAGDGIRRFTKPDFIITDGKVSSQLWAKIFWSIGPQTIGAGIGALVGMAIVIK